MPFCCPIHGYYSPPLGTTLAMCPICAAGYATNRPPSTTTPATVIAAPLVITDELVDRCAHALLAHLGVSEDGPASEAELAWAREDTRVILAAALSKEQE